MIEAINGHHLYCELHGPAAGRPVVLLHHGLGSVRAWKAQIPALAAAGYRVIAYDRWGYGGSDERVGIDIPEFEQDLQDLETLWERLGLAEAALVGHSDGGTIALAFTARHPQRVACLATVAAHIYLDECMPAGILTVQAGYQADLRFRSGLERAHGEKYPQAFRNWFEGWYRPEVRSWDMRPTLAGITCPVWVVQGLEDEHAAPRHAEDLAAALPGAQLWLAAGAAHMLPQDHPDEFNSRLLAFLHTHYA